MSDVTYHFRDLGELSDFFRWRASRILAERDDLRSKSPGRRTAINQLTAEGNAWLSAAEFIKSTKIGEKHDEVK